MLSVSGSLAAVALLAAAGEPAPLHPADGPDVDLRIRIEPNAVDFQILMNLAFVDEIVSVPRQDPGTLDEVARAAAHRALLEFFRERNRVLVDDLPVMPVDGGFDVTEADPRLLPHFPRFGKRALCKARLRLRYPLLRPPKRVAMTWGAFPPDQTVETADGVPPPLRVAAQLTAAGVDHVLELSAEEPEYVWHDAGVTVEDRFLPVPRPRSAPRLPVPVLSLAVAAVWLCLSALVGWRRRRRRFWWSLLLLLPPALAGGFVLRRSLVVGVPVPFTAAAPLPDEVEALAVFTSLHANIYRAFAYTRESDVYDALARSVEGELLDRLYEQIYRSLVLHEDGGAVCRVQAVRTVDYRVERIGLLPPEDRVGFHVLARWQVDGSVFHWGHSHACTSEYQARYAVAQTPAGWRIAAQQVLEQLRVDGADAPPAAEGGR